MPDLTMRSEDKVIDGDGGYERGGGVGGGVGDSSTTNGNNHVRWEKFLPKMILRVLLVEADDSTRQIIAALLRKCSYKVAAVSDGLKAWEVLKGRSHHIDLILTEVELPSISGFALLTLIMEHPICKNIPVIMMSADDSVSTVYKCMLRGAADFLVKPVRKNELKNLWQHVWRRQASTAGSKGHQEESSGYQKVEATAENNATNNRSGSYIACIERNRECIEKGSDAQSSCTKPDMEAYSEQSNDIKKTRGNNKQKQDRGAEEKNMAMDVPWEHVDASRSREAIDLIGLFDSCPKTMHLRSGGNKVDRPSPMLDLSLRRPRPSSTVKPFSDDRHRLKQSDVSAFSRYINKNQPPVSASVSISKNMVEYISDTHSAPVGSSQRKMTSPHKSQCQLWSPNERAFPVPVLVPLRGLTCGMMPPFMFQANPSENRQGHAATEATEDRSPSTDNGNVCNSGTLTRFNSVGSGSNGHVNVAIDWNRSIQREAALNKFRMKRKDRCFDKKVRYESRKKLAEQRPRVKGQFVRQGQTSNPSPMEADAELGTTKSMA